LNHKKEDFDQLLAKAFQFRIEGVTQLTDAIYEIYNRAKNPDNIKKYRLPWESVNRLIGGGLVRKRLTTIGGYPGVGKTSFALQILYSLYKEYKLPSLYWCMEMPEVELATKIIQLEYDREYGDMSPDEALHWSEEMKDIPIYFGYSSKIKPDVFYNTMKLARDRYGVGIGVFDNLQRMVRSDSEADMAKASGMFKDLVMDLNIMFLLISQPRKRSMENQDVMPTYDELKGSSAIPADADEVIILYRKRERKESEDPAEEVTGLDPLTRVIIDKSRFSGGGISTLKFIGNKSKFVEVIK
jgi:replicative DNA helicase